MTTALGVSMNTTDAMTRLRMPTTQEDNDMICRGFDHLPATPTDSNDPMSSNSASGSFVTKLFAMVETEPDSVVTWIREGTAFCIVQPKVLAETFLPKYFRHGRFSSLIRQLNFYSFYKVTEGSAIIYQHSHFRKGRPDLLVHIKRRGAGKAKDPWIDPLSNKHSEQDSPMYAPLTTTTLGASDMCSSPSSKPLSSHKPALLMNDNMSPALKPGTSPLLTPPLVDLNPRKEMAKTMMKQPVRAHLAAISHSPTMFGLKENPNTGTLMAVRPFDEISQGNMKPPLWRTTSSSVPIKADLEFPLFDKSVKTESTADQMIDDAILDNLSFGDMMDASVQPFQQAQTPVVVDPRSMVLARDCLKGPAASSSSECSGIMMQSNSMLFDPESDDTWEVPLSPLNDPEDIPWLDLSF